MENLLNMNTDLWLLALSLNGLCALLLSTLMVYPFIGLDIPVGHYPSAKLTNLRRAFLLVLKSTVISYLAASSIVVSFTVGELAIQSDIDLVMLKDNAILFVMATLGCLGLVIFVQRYSTPETKDKIKGVFGPIAAVSFTLLVAFLVGGTSGSESLTVLVATNASALLGVTGILFFATLGLRFKRTNKRQNAVIVEFVPPNEVRTSNPRTVNMATIVSHITSAKRPKSVRREAQKYGEWFESNPNDQSSIIRVKASGSRAVGTIVNGKFRSEK
jgi:hypothetical protein